MADETTFCPDCAGERGGFSTGTEKCQRHKTDDIISTLTQDLAISRRACEESGLAYETLADEVAALRAALESATRERDEAREACRDEAWKARNVSAALDRFTASAREAMNECVGRDMEIAARKRLASCSSSVW